MRNVIDGDFIAMLEARDLHIKNAMNGLFGGNRRSKAYGSSCEFADFREYAPGDDLRRIDWNLYARFEKLYLRLFVDEKQLHHRIYIDTSASMEWGEPKKSELSLKIAAALGFLSVQAMDRVSFYALRKNSCEEIAARVVGREAFYNAANSLGKTEFYGEGDIEKALKSHQDCGHDDGMSIIISDFLTDCDWQSAVDYLIFKGREVNLIQVLSRDEVTPNLSGKVFMLDTEAKNDGDKKNLKSEITKSSLKAYEKAFLYHQKQIKDFASSRNIGFLSVCSDNSVEKILLLKACEEGLVR